MLRSFLLALVISVPTVSVLAQPAPPTREPLEQRLNAAEAAHTLRQAYFDASGDPPLTLEQAFSHLAGAPLSDPSFLLARQRSLDEQRDARARERLDAGGSDRSQAVAHACDAEDAADALEERLLSALTVGLEIVPGLNADSIDLARGPWRAARDSAGRMAEDDPNFPDARIFLKQLAAMSRFVIFLLALIFVLSTLVSFSNEALLALGGTVALAFGFAFKDIFASLMAGVILLFDRPFQVGDRVSFEGHYGEVTDIGLRAVRLNGRRMTKAHPQLTLIGIVLIAASCSGPTPEPEAPALVYSDRMSTWFEGAWPDVRVSEDEQWAAFGTWHQLALVEVSTGQAGSGKLDGVRALAFRGGGLVRQDFERKWGGAEADSLPDGVTPRWSPNRTSLALHRPDDARRLTLRDRDGERTYDLPGEVTAFEWTPDAGALFALSYDESGLSTLSHLDAATGGRRVVAADLDAPRRAHSIGVARDASIVYLPLASPNAPDNESRHHPTVDRDLDIYAVNTDNGELQVVVATPQEEASVTVVGNHLYWTRSLHRQSIVALPATGGQAHLVAEGGQISYWSPGSDQIAFTVGDLRSSDSPLNFDIEIVDVDGDARPLSSGSARRALVGGYHEDFTPAWSPDGAWLAYHSHRSPTAVPLYTSEGATDDIYLLRAGESAEAEIRLTDFCWEAGMVDWSPEGQRLLFATWDKQGVPGISLPWIANLDLETGTATSFERVAFPEPLRSARMLSWSPVAEEIAIENDDEDGTQSLWIVSLVTGLAEKLVDIECRTYCGVDWAPDGQSLIYSALVDRRMQLFAISRSGGEVTQLTNDSGSILLPQVSADGRWISATRIELTRELLRIEL